MRQQQIQLIRQSWKIFRSIPPEYIGDVFYNKLFIEAPSVRRLFIHPMPLQYKKLVDMITLIVGRLDNIQELTEDIREMAIRHLGYGVKPSHYRDVGNTLLWTLEQALGRDWTEEMREAWSTCYMIISDNMISATEQC